jgi:hypothetical protein
MAERTGEEASPRFFGPNPSGLAARSRRSEQRNIAPATTAANPVHRICFEDDTTFPLGRYPSSSNFVSLVDAYSRTPGGVPLLGREAYKPFQKLSVALTLSTMKMVDLKIEQGKELFDRLYEA